MSSAAGPPLARPQQPLHHVPVHHVDSCCCSRCLRAAAPCPPPCRALPRAVLTTPRPSHPQPSARNRPGERMSLLDGSTYDRPDAEVLPLITPAAARATNLVRRISHATRSGQRRPVAKRSTGRGQGKGRRGRRRRGRTTPHIRHRSRAPRKHPVPHIRSTHLVAHPPPLIAAVFHAQLGWLPLHVAAGCSTSVAVVQALLAANPEADSATAIVRRPSPLAAWMRCPERSSEVIICNQGQSVVIIRNQRALSGTQRALSGTQSHSVATRWAPQRPSAGPSEAIRGTQRHSEVIRDHSEPLRATQWHSAALRGTQRALGTRSSPPLALRSASKHPVPLIRSPSSSLIHAQMGNTPLTLAAANSSSVAVVQALLAANPEAASATAGLRRPSPLAAWMRGPERSS
jgi:hypothetical protein